MEKQVLAVDVDEVLVPFVENMSTFLNREFKTETTIEDYFSYEFDKVWKCSVDECQVKVNAYLQSEDFRSSKPIDGAREALTKLKEHYTLVVVTSRLSSLKDFTEKWLEQHFPGLFEQALFGNHYGEGKRRKKSEMCMQVGAKMLIDDCLKYAIDCNDANIKCVLFDRNNSYPWNDSDDLPELTTRATSWTEITNLLLPEE
eukprot:TRINITY_DN5028_c0_g1_i1.p1 TRINITY_DN5028_c0_g1~~TRINITY_DN5028_c0_g1_i1.p1  ORF type:complete len:201 (-),score=37.73 TRINITY_DN5028_c0_g1_i1:9-611(-)